MEVKEEFKNLIPALSAEEYAQLEANILEEGIREPIITWNGFIIDGHNRFSIAQRFDLEYKTTSKHFTSEIDVKIFYQNELGGQLEVFDLFVAGEVDAMISWPSTSYDKRIGILNTPYMVTSWDEAFEAYKPGGWVNSVLNNVFNDRKYICPDF